jgi:hypothetical protein
MITNIFKTISKKFNENKIVFDLLIKLIKICLAVHYANTRKLNFAKSLIGGTVKLDKNNVFFKVKNTEI